MTRQNRTRCTSAACKTTTRKRSHSLAVQETPPLSSLLYTLNPAFSKVLVDSSTCMHCHVRYRNSNLQTYRAPLKSQAQDTHLFTSAVSNHRDCLKGTDAI